MAQVSNQIDLPKCSQLLQHLSSELSSLSIRCSTPSNSIDIHPHRWMDILVLGDKSDFKSPSHPTHSMSIESMLREYSYHIPTSRQIRWYVYQPSRDLDRDIAETNRLILQRSGPFSLKPSAIVSLNADITQIFLQCSAFDDQTYDTFVTNHLSDNLKSPLLSYPHIFIPSISLKYLHWKRYGSIIRFIKTIHKLSMITPESLSNAQYLSEETL